MRGRKPALCRSAAGSYLCESVRCNNHVWGFFQFAVLFFFNVPLVASLQSRNKLPWNRLTFGIIIFSFLSQGVLLKRAEAAFAVHQLSLTQ